MITSERLFEKRKRQILKNIPKEFHEALFYYVHQQGHAGISEEMLITLEDLVNVLEEPFIKFINRIIEDANNRIRDDENNGFVAIGYRAKI